MDERRLSLPLHDIREPVGSDAAPIVVQAVDKRVVHTGGQIEQLPAEPPTCENSQIVFYGDEQQVREGFAIALRAMGVDTNFLPTDIPLPATHPNREDN